MNNICYLIGGILSSSIAYIIYKKPASIIYPILVKTNDLYEKIKNIEYVKFRINSISEIYTDNNLYLTKGKKIYQRKFYNRFYDNLNFNNLNFNQKLYIDYTQFNKNYIVICTVNQINEIKNQVQKSFKTSNVIMAIEGSEDITKLIKKYEGMNGDFNFLVTNEKIRIKDIIKDNNDNIINNLSIIKSDGKVKILTIDDFIN